MKKFGILFLLISFLLIGCDETSTTVCSLTNNSFSKAFSDSIVFIVESEGAPVRLKGDLTLDEGECEISLKAPTGDSIYVVDTTFVNDTIFSIDSISLTDTIFSIDSIFVADTLFTTRPVPVYQSIYDSKFKATDDFSIDEKFERKIGKWTLKTNVTKVDEETPSGSFDFNVIYND
ncbi:MAG TPA: hypothetical protein PKH79_05645 [Prolixibacteraceae bacterium]|nr:hypothetical protein [Prolixibacteraceae bacterium]HPS12480.1 hypothetical protein [Prolixibacteraceae bacterium]